MDSSSIPLYPLRFRPILKQPIWGGKRIISFKHLTTDAETVGESWEISSLPGNESIVAEGPLAGAALGQLVADYGERLVGRESLERYGTTFPLLVKFIDARSDLSIQVHPGDELARRRHGSLGKSEMWYVIEAEPGAQIISGLTAPLTPQDYRKRVEEGSFTDVLKYHDAHPGDVFYLPAGRIHAIGGGVFLAEIQEASDVTYRIFDYNRLDRDGRPRRLHTDWAEEAIDYRAFPDYRTRYRARSNEPVELLATPHFGVTLYDLDRPQDCDYSERDSFVILLCTEGRSRLRVLCRDAAPAAGSLTEHEFCAGDTLLLPATAQSMHIDPQGKVKFLEAYR